MLALAVLAPLTANRLLVSADAPIGKPGKFTYLYSPIPAIRLATTPWMLPLASLGGVAVYLAGSAVPRRRTTGLALGMLTMAGAAYWAYAAPPFHVQQHVFTLQSPSHDGAFVLETGEVESVRAYLRGFPERARTSEQAMRGTRVISNPPLATLAAFAVRRTVQASPRLRAFLLERFMPALRDMPPETLERSMTALLYAWLLTTLWLLAGPLLYGLARLYFDPAAALAWALCTLLSPMTLLFSPGKDPAQLLTIAGSLWLWLAAARRGSPWPAAASGIAAVLSTMVGLVHIWVGLIAFAATAWHALGEGALRSFLVRCALPAVAAAAAAIGLLHLTLGWNVIETVFAVSRSQALVTRGPSAMPLAWQALGIPLFLLFAGPALWAMALWRPDRVVGDPNRRFAFALLALTLAAMLATVGFTNVETPRLWIAFVPLLMLGLALRLPAFAVGGLPWRGLLAALVAAQLTASALQWSFMDMRETEMRLSEQRFYR